VKKAAILPVAGLLLVACFSLAVALEPQLSGWREQEGADNVLKVLLGDGRRIFASHAFVQADVYFHSGYYPSVFDQNQAPKGSRHMTAREGEPEAERHEREMNFLGPPLDWIERFGRQFMITEHTHLEAGNEREILPWLKLSAELDPQRVDTYTVAAFWLRRELGKPQEAEKFLRQGLRNNPTSHELLFELGKLYQENYHDPNRARDAWELAIRRWDEYEGKKKEPDRMALEQIAINLARLEENAGKLRPAISHLQRAAAASPHPETLQKQIDELKAKLPPSS
jgi:tetratricopeptide (TPR) repeat protein